MLNGQQRLDVIDDLISMLSDTRRSSDNQWVYKTHLPLCSVTIAGDNASTLFRVIVDEHYGDPKERLPDELQQFDGVRKRYLGNGIRDNTYPALKGIQFQGIVLERHYGGPEKPPSVKCREERDLTTPDRERFDALLQYAQRELRYQQRE